MQHVQYMMASGVLYTLGLAFFQRVATYLSLSFSHHDLEIDTSQTGTTASPTHIHTQFIQFHIEAISLAGK